MCRVLWVSLLLFPAAAWGAEASQAVDYASQIKPLLARKCYACHGALKQASNLRLDTRRSLLRGGDGGDVVVPGRAAESPLLARIQADPEQRMPPHGAGAPLTPDEVALVRLWIEQGAPAPDEPEPASPREHWAFRPLTKPAPPTLRHTTWPRNGVDQFVCHQHERLGLRPQAEATPLVLFRRLHFDLLGLPPTPEAVRALGSQTSGNWYTETVERLLLDPRHGERWARHWMDIWRYSDWSGLNGQLRSSQKHIWHWRDWIVESLNADLPYDEMVRQMLAADELYPNDLSRLRATGYLARSWNLFSRNQWMDDVVEHVSKGFLGLTANCAKCHDHKYDPITQRDYYALRAFFEPYHVRLDVLPGGLDVEQAGLPRAYDRLPDDPTYLFVRGDERQPDTSSVIAPAVPALLRFAPLDIAPVALPAESWQPARRAWVIASYLKAARAKVAVASEEVFRTRDRTHHHVAAKAALELAEAELRSLQARLAAMRAGWAVRKTETGFLRDATDGERTREAIRSEREVSLARAKQALADAEAALQTAVGEQRKETLATRDAARKSVTSAVERLASPIRGSHRYTPLVGAKWTPTRFVRSTRDDRHVPFLPQSTGRRRALAQWITHRSNPLTARVAVNHLWARHMGSPLVESVFDFGMNGAPPKNGALLDWLACELVDNGWSMKHVHRLIVNSATYRMASSARGARGNREIDPDNRYGWRRDPSPLEAELVRDAILTHAGALDDTMSGPAILAEAQASSRRRSLYFFHAADSRNRFLTAFNAPVVGECYRRSHSIQPQQALALSNSKLVSEASPRVARRLSQLAPDEEGFLWTGFACLLGMEPGPAALRACHAALDHWDEAGCSPLEARTHLIRALMNHNDFVTLR